MIVKPGAPPSVADNGTLISLEEDSTVLRLPSLLKLNSTAPNVADYQGTQSHEQALSRVHLSHFRIFLLQRQLLHLYSC